MEIDQNILEINIYNEFCNIDDNFMYSFFDDDKYPDERKVLIQLVSLRRSISKSNPSTVIYPHIIELMKIMHNLSKEIDTYNKAQRKSIDS